MAENTMNACSPCWEICPEIVIGGRIVKREDIINRHVLDSSGRIVGRVVDVISFYHPSLSGMAVMGSGDTALGHFWVVLEVEKKYLRYGVDALILLSAKHIYDVGDALRLCCPIEEVRDKWIELFV
ncbi:MAG: hypothetical protein DRN20_02345 [Thermoplasmata archaeon]|nr:MAG: hypothetical protein DRN20_02345 [Thermoplasmata archaeon]